MQDGCVQDGVKASKCMLAGNAEAGVGSTCEEGPEGSVPATKHPSPRIWTATARHCRHNLRHGKPHKACGECDYDPAPHLHAHDNACMVSNKH